MKPPIVVVGAGAAGCVIASRLSEDPGRRVLLIEAGKDQLPGREHWSVRDCFPSSSSDPERLWHGLQVAVSNRPRNGAPDLRPFPQGRGMGGGSAIMGMLALRGLPADYDEWSELGAHGWDWEGVLPYFRRLESDLDFSGSEHGLDGPIPVRRHFEKEWPPYSLAFAKALLAMGYPTVSDANVQFDDGVIPLPMSNTKDGRVSSASGYLDAEVRKRPNLEIVCETYAERVVFNGTSVSGIELSGARGRYSIACQDVILTAGAIQSPALLLRSGIGPAPDLQRAGIRVVADRRGVGSNLLNHPAVYLSTWLDPHARQDPSQAGWCQNGLRYSSGHAGCAQGDMFLFGFNKSGHHGLGRAIGSINAAVYKSYSSGSVSLDSQRVPDIRFNLLSDERDRERLIECVALALSVLRQPKLAALRNEVFLAKGPWVARVARPKRRNRALSAVLARLFDKTTLIRRLALGDLLVDPNHLARNMEAIAELVDSEAFPMGHVCGTCRLGNLSDPMAVCAPDASVIGLRGIRVADASLMPTIPRGNTHIPTLMVAEKVSQLSMSVD